MTNFFDNYLRRTVDNNTGGTTVPPPNTTTTTITSADITHSLSLLTNTINKIVKAINYDYNFNDNINKLISGKASKVHTHELASSTTDGFMSKEDKQILANIHNKSNSFQVKVFKFYEESLEWIVIHNQNTQDFFVQIYDESNRLIHTTTQIIDNNKFLIRFTSPVKGRANVVFSVGI